MPEVQVETVGQHVCLDWTGLAHKNGVESSFALAALKIPRYNLRGARKTPNKFEAVPGNLNKASLYR